MALSEPISKEYVPQTIRIFWDVTKKEKYYGLLSLNLLISQVLLGVAAPFFASKAIASVITEQQAMKYFWFMAAAVVMGLVLNLIGIRSSMRMQARTMERLHQFAYQRLLHRGIGFFNNSIGGKLVSDALDFSNYYGQFVTHTCIKAASLLIVVAVGLIVLLFTSLVFAGIVLVVLIGLTYWTVNESRRRSDLRQKRLASYKKVAAHLSDTIVNAPTVKAFATESSEIRRDEILTDKLRHTREKDWVRATTSETARIGVVFGLQLALIFTLVVLARDNPAILASGIFAFTYTMTLTTRFFEINTITRQAEEALLQASSMTAMILEPDEVQDTADAQPLTVENGEIMFNNVEFCYPDSLKKPVFKNFALHIKPGEKIGLVGHSGGGKSTLTKLLLRFEDITKGNIVIDGQNIAEVTQKSLREAIAYVPQEPLLFHRTIRENVAYADEDASEESVIDAARQAFAHDFIMSLPKGYDTIVGERGVKLSGGQRQRIAIARATLKNAPILVLDEATSALDSESEQLIQKALWRLMENRTTIVIAHRLSTIKKLDRIIVIQNGRIKEEGKHGALIEQDGVYAKLWEHQSGGFIED